MPNDNKNMLAEFIGTLIKFLWKLILWALWAIFRLLEQISQGIASYIKNSLLQ